MIAIVNLIVMCSSRYIFKYEIQIIQLYQFINKKNAFLINIGSAYLCFTHN